VVLIIVLGKEIRASSRRINFVWSLGVVYMYFTVSAFQLLYSLCACINLLDDKTDKNPQTVTCNVLT
jgi:hypothetical protein